MGSHSGSAPTQTKQNELFIRIAPYHYVHVLNLNTNVTKLVLGPQCLVCMRDEKVVLGPEKMISIPAMMYCVIENPVLKDDDGNIVVDSYGQAKVKLGDTEIRFAQDPFPLYPGEALARKIEALPVVSANHALHLRALTNFVDEDGNQKIAGDEWLFEGPGIYRPRKEVIIVEEVSARMIECNKALVLKAKRNCVDRNGHNRFYGEEWLVKTPGAYLPGVYEEVIEEREAYSLTDTNALHLKAIKDFTDDFNKKRRMGEEWLITKEDVESHICGVYENVIDVVSITVLDAHQYCVILNPVDENGIPQLGKKKVVRGEKCFFLRPGEELESGVQNSYVLQMDEGLILRAQAQFEDEVSVFDGDSGTERKHKVIRRPGDRWILRGPLEYIPPADVEVVSRRKVIPLDRHEGIYVRNTQTGHVRAVIGEAYMLSQDEELWEKKLPQEVIQILMSQKDPLADRGLRDSSPKASLDLTHVVTYQVPHNAAVQIYDYREKKARVEFGPNLVMLGPDEQFTRLSLSGGKPKKPNVIKSLCLLLGPDFCTDVIIVETADHARLSLQLSYNWHFDVPQPCSAADATKLFSVPDFVGDVCKAIASRVRGTVASVQFDDFHKHSSRIIRAAVFGLDNEGKIREKFVFSQNNLCITSIDVQSVEPVDQRTRDSLQKSVQLAIEITTNSQEAAARHEAERVEQEARGRLERQKIEDETAVEKARQTLVETRVELAVLESAGQATAEARSRAEAARIEAQASVENSKLRAEAMMIDTDAELERLKKARTAELEYISEKDKLTLKFKDEEAKIEIARFNAMVSSIGPDTLKAIAAAGPEHNIRMLSALGLRSTLITDGTTPINLLNTAHGLIGTSMESGCKRRFDGSGSKYDHGTEDTESQAPDQ